MPEAFCFLRVYAKEKRFAKHRELRSRDRKLLAHDEVSGISVIRVERMHARNSSPSRSAKINPPRSALNSERYKLRRAGAAGYRTSGTSWNLVDLRGPARAYEFAMPALSFLSARRAALSFKRGSRANPRGRRPCMLRAQYARNTWHESRRRPPLLLHSHKNDLR